MKLHDLKPAPGSTKNRKRVGRGPGGTDKTAGRGHKGQLSRSGAGKGSFFGGGGSTLISRLPKRGFNNVGTIYEVVNLADLERFEAGAVVDRAALEMAGLVASENTLEVARRAVRLRAFRALGSTRPCFVGVRRSTQERPHSRALNARAQTYRKPGYPRKNRKKRAGWQSDNRLLFGTGPR